VPLIRQLRHPCVAVFAMMAPMDATAIIVDVDNLHAKERMERGPSLRELMAGLADRLHGPTHACLVGGESSPDADSALKDIAQSLGAELILVGASGPQPSADVVMAVRAMEELPRVARLVLVSGDQDFIPVVRAAKRAGVRTTVVSAPGDTAVGLALTADDRIDATDFWRGIEGLIAPGEGVRAARAVMNQFSRAQDEIIAIDPYVGPSTIRLLAWTASSVKVLVIGQKIDEAACDNARQVIDAGRTLQLLRHDRIHDRWFRIDGRWWHSGGSLKDVGAKFTRISAIGDPGEVSDHERMLAELLSSATTVDL
jgi:predicted HAD superfamily phosphohydrolase YqeG